MTGRGRRSWHRALTTQRLAAVGRPQQILVLAAVTGALTGLAVAGFERVTAEHLVDTLLGLPLWVQATVPGLGLLGSTLCLRLAGRSATSATTDDYIRTYHDPKGRLDLRAVPFKLLAAVATLGTGSPLGYEGPAMYAGAGVGSALQRRWHRLFGPSESKALLVAGAAAGVAAIFKAPVTGLVFALEVPYQDDLARRMLLPAAISSAASYVTFASLAGTEPILPVSGQPPFNLVDLGGAALVGIVAGLLARAFIEVVTFSKSIGARGRPWSRALLGGCTIGATVLAGHLLFDESLVLGPGYDALRWSLEPSRSVWALIALGTLRVVGTGAAVAGGGTGGLFIPLVIQGALVGTAIGGVVDAESSTLFPLVGMAAFLGAGYRVPLAAVVFVAEFTGRPGFVVPGLVAAVTGQLVMGRASVSPYQRARRIGHLEARMQLPLASLVDGEARTAPSDATVDEVFWQHLVGDRQRSVAVVDGTTYRGMVAASDLRAVAREAWASTPIEGVMRTDLPVADLGWSVSDALASMESSGFERLAVCQDQRYVGVVSARDLVRVDELLDEVRPTIADDVDPRRER